MKLAEIAEKIDGTLQGDPNLEITCVCGVDEQRPQAITFAENVKAIAQAERQGFAALVIPAKFSTKLPSIAVANARVGYAKLLNLYNPPRQHQPGIHPTAVVDASAKIDTSACIGPYAVIGARAEVCAGALVEAHAIMGADTYLGQGSRLLVHASMADKCRVGAACLIGSHTHLTDGTQVGDDVEIGARALLEGCTISPKCRLDNMTLVRRGATLAPGAIMVSHSSVHEGAQVGMFCVLAAQSVVGPNAKVGNFATVGGRVFVETELPEGNNQWSGNPPLPYREDMKRLAQRAAVPKLVARLEAALRQRKQ